MLKISTVKENCFPAMYQRGKQIAEEKAYKSFLIEEISEDTKEVSAQSTASTKRPCFRTAGNAKPDSIPCFLFKCRNTAIP